MRMLGRLGSCLGRGTSPGELQAFMADSIPYSSVYLPRYHTVDTMPQLISPRRRIKRPTTLPLACGQGPSARGFSPSR